MPAHAANLSDKRRGHENRICYNCNKVGHIAKDCPEPRKPRRMREQNRHDTWKTRLKSFAASFTAESSTDWDEQKLDDHVETMLSSWPVSSEGSTEEELDQQENQLDELPNNSSEERSDKLSDNPAILGSGAGIQAPTEFGYEHFHIAAYHAQIGEQHPIAEKLKEQFLDAEDCLTHVWPAEFQILQQHAAARLDPILRERRLLHGMGEIDLPQADLEWILLQAAWLVSFLSSPAEEVVEQLIWTYYAALEEGDEVAEALQEAVYQMMDIPEEAKAISVIALYPRVLHELQQMVLPTFFRPEEIAPEVPETDVSSTHGDKEQRGTQSWDSCTVDELRELAQAAEVGENYKILSQIQKVLMSRAEGRTQDELTTSSGETPTDESPPTAAEAKPTEPEPSSAEKRSATDTGQNIAWKYLLYTARNKDGHKTYAVWVLQDCPKQAPEGARLVMKFRRVYTALNHLSQMKRLGNKQQTQNWIATVTLYDPLKTLPKEIMDKYRVETGVAFDQWRPRGPTELVREAGGKDHSENSSKPKESGGPTLSLEARKSEVLEKPIDTSTATGTDREPARVTAVTADDKDTRNDLEGTASAVSTRTAPIRYSMAPFRNDDASSKVRRMKTFLESMDHVGAYVMVLVDGDEKSAPLQHTWLYDSGASVSQISGAAAARLWSLLRPVGQAFIRCDTATQSTVVERSLCMLKGCRIVDLSRGNASVSVSTHVMINPDLRVHPFILGLNTMCDLRLSASMRTERVTDEVGVTYQLLSYAKAIDWDTSSGGLASPLKRRSFCTNRSETRDGGTNGDSAGR